MRLPEQGIGFAPAHSHIHRQGRLELQHLIVPVNRCDVAGKLPNHAADNRIGLLDIIDHRQMSTAGKFGSKRSGQFLVNANIAAAIDEGLDIDRLNVRRQKRILRQMITAP